LTFCIHAYRYNIEGADRFALIIEQLGAVCKIIFVNANLLRAV